MKKNKLLALTSAALGLPGIAAADTPPTETTIAFNQTNYKEGSVDKSLVFDGDAQRYEIDVQQLRILMPARNNYSVDISLQNETLTGASPWYVDVDTNPDKPVVMSSASIEETRVDGAVSVRKYEDFGNAGFTLAGSNENDYSSKSISADVSINLNDKHSTLSLGASHSKDNIEPTQGNYQTNTLSDSKQSTSGFIGWSQVINKTTIMQFGSSVTNLKGFLSDAYKFRDRRPETRTRWTWNLGVRKYLPEHGSTLHADYRYYRDDWEIESHTISTNLWYPLGDHFHVVPSLRWYSQNQAPFFANTADSTGVYHSSDYRLSAYGAFTVGVKVAFKHGKFKANFVLDRYLSDESYGISSDYTSPALVDFTRGSLGVEYSW